MFDFGNHGCRTPDRPYSLFEGMSGTVCFLDDILNVETAKFPCFYVWMIGQSNFYKTLQEFWILLIGNSERIWRSLKFSEKGSNCAADQDICNQVKNIFVDFKPSYFSERKRNMSISCGIWSEIGKKLIGRCESDVTLIFCCYQF